jgi:hypothetical protein
MKRKRKKAKQVKRAKQAKRKQVKRRNGYALAAKLMRSNVLDKGGKYDRKKEKKVEE